MSVPTAATAAPAGTTGETENYLVLFKGSSSPRDAESIVTRAGGTVVANYAEIGVLVARSNNTAFDETVRANDKVEGASATTDFATRLETVEPDQDGAPSGPQPGDLPNAPATDADTFSPLQWDMRQIQAPEAHAITGGSEAVVVGTIDTGVDYRHPDLRANISDAHSANCLGGKPVPGAAAADDDNGHGTHTAGTIAAASNGKGIVGVAPNVQIASIKAATAEGYFFVEAVVCAFMWAAEQKIDVTNNSYFVDPFLFNCRNDEEQRAIWKAVQRAVRYAMQEGVTVVASEGNNSEDLSHPSQDRTSPDYPPGNEVEREVTNACVVLPVELPGVIGVTATGSTVQDTSAGQYPDNLKSFYSSYGVSTADVAAPGGDSVFFTPDSVNGRVLSTYPANQPCTRSKQEPTGEPTYPVATYCYLQGTSMAGPHVAGVAALVISRFGDLETPQNGKLRPTQVEQLIQQTADPQSCPETLPARYETVGAGSESGTPPTCQGGDGHTSWYGTGQVDALAAVTNDRSNG
ncbi:S8 family peptidase [Blastococcus mobilis]|nr:S8 family serine peptidase [Blastococcus mobilis]